MKIYKQTPIYVLLASFVWSWSSLLVSATWWLLNVPPHDPTEHTTSTKGAKLYCNSLRFLSQRQRELCIQHPDIMRKISEGVHLGVRECGYQFRNSRWNCTMYPGRPKQHAFEPVMRNTRGFCTPSQNFYSVYDSACADLASGIPKVYERVPPVEVLWSFFFAEGKERAYINAILSAAVSFTVTEACSRGELKLDCGCARMKRNYDHEARRRAFEWGGCSDDVAFGDGISRDFFEENIHNSRKGLEVLDLHNKAAGRREIVRNTLTACRCHGITGSCQQNVCWRAKPRIRNVSTELFQRFNSALKVRVRKSRVHPVKSRRSLELSDLIYLRNSPKFCKANLSKGSYGTAGRRCNGTTTGPDSCSYMCCNRGYNTVEETKESSCNCKFEWCCNVNCETCREMQVENYCK